MTKIIGVVKHNFNAKTVANAYRKENKDMVNDVATATQKLLKRVLSTGDGRTNPSKPGRPPRVRTGTLRRSWTTKSNRIARNWKGGYRLTLGSNVKYARALEYGYPPRNLKPRPYVSTVVNSRKLRAYINKRMKQTGDKVRATVRRKAQVKR